MEKVRLSTSCAGIGVGVGVGVGVGAGAGAGADVNQQSDEGGDWHLHLLYPLWRSGSPNPFFPLTSFSHPNTFSSLTLSSGSYVRRPCSAQISVSPKLVAASDPLPLSSDAYPLSYNLVVKY